MQKLTVLNDFIQGLIAEDDYKNEKKKHFFSYFNL